MNSIDFHKAPYGVEWNYLVTCLQAFCIGPHFIRWVKKDTVQEYTKLCY